MVKETPSVIVFKEKLQTLLSNHGIKDLSLLNEIIDLHSSFLPVDTKRKCLERNHENKDSDNVIIEQLKNGETNFRKLENELSAARTVLIRRKYLQNVKNIDLKDIPYFGYGYEKIKGSCCENAIGYITVPMGIIGPLKIDDKEIYVPLATTEGALIASISRGCKAINYGTGVTTDVEDIGMTRAPHFTFDELKDARNFCNWIKDPSTFQKIKSKFEETSSYANLRKIKPYQQGENVYLRFIAFTGDAMGMNMISKGCERAVQFITENFKAAKFQSLSSNLCCDKKAAAINVLEGRGKRVISKAVIKAEIVESIFHTTVDKMVNLCIKKCWEGSTMAGTIGGNNAQAANVVAGIFLATGQDLAQVVCSSMCLTTMKKLDCGDLVIHCSMNCLEVGTIGGGTNLAAQKAALKIMKCDGPHPTTLGQNACRLAKIICSTVLAGEISLIAALCTNDLVKSHMKLNRSAANITTNTVSMHTVEHSGPQTLEAKKLTIKNKIKKVSKKIRDDSDCFLIM